MTVTKRSSMIKLRVCPIEILTFLFLRFFQMLQLLILIFQRTNFWKIKWLSQKSILKQLTTIKIKKHVHPVLDPCRSVYGHICFWMQMVRSSKRCATKLSIGMDGINFQRGRLTPKVGLYCMLRATLEGQELSKCLLKTTRLILT